jgi:hypothetical protein
MAEDDVSTKEIYLLTLKVLRVDWIVTSMPQNFSGSAQAIQQQKDKNGATGANQSRPHPAPAGLWP